jgi:hypothetical protein
MVPAVPTRFTFVLEIVDAGRTLVTATVGARMIVHLVVVLDASPVVHVLPPTAAVVVAAVKLCATLPVDVPVPPKFDIDPTCPGSEPAFDSVRTAVNDPVVAAGIVVGATPDDQAANSIRTPPIADGVAVGLADDVPEVTKFFAHPRIAVPVDGTFRYTTPIAQVRFAADVAMAIVAEESAATQFCL